MTNVPPSPFVRRNVNSLIGQGRVLDLGCHTGRNSLYLAGNGIYVDGIDIDPVAISVARSRAVARGLASVASFRVGDAFGLSQTYGAVICNEMLQLVPKNSWETLFASIRNRTTPGGVHVISGYVSEHGAPAHGSPFMPGELNGIYRMADWNVMSYIEQPTRVAECAGGVTLQSLACIVAQKPR